MKLNSFIDNIRDTIATGSSKNVKIVDRSLLNLLISDEGNADSNTNINESSFRDMRNIVRRYLQPNWALRFPVTHLLGNIILVLSMAALLPIYGLMALLGGLTSHKISLSRAIHSPRTNLVIVISALVAVIVLVVSMMVFFINDVMLFSPERNTNMMGALTISQPCYRQHSIFMFNSATHWADTGIDLVKGDVVRISGSGSFYSSISDKRISAEKNTRPRHALNNIAYTDTTSTNQDGHPYYIYNEVVDGNIPRFGSLLYQIAPSRRACINNDEGDGPKCQTSGIRQANYDLIDGVLNEEFIVKESGTLFVCVNDIYLSRQNVEEMFHTTQNDTVINANAKSMFKEWTDSITPNELYLRMTALSRTETGRELWFEDNCGDILLNIQIERNIWSSPRLGSLDKMYSSAFRGLENVVNGNRGIRSMLIIFALCTAGWLMTDYMVGLTIRGRQKKKTINSTHSYDNEK